MSLTSYRTAPPRGKPEAREQASDDRIQRTTCGSFFTVNRSAIVPGIVSGLIQSLGSDACPPTSVIWNLPPVRFAVRFEGLAATYSPTCNHAVPSALRVFTVEFGMGSSVGPLAVTTRPSKRAAEPDV